MSNQQSLHPKVLHTTLPHSSHLTTPNSIDIIHDESVMNNNNHNINQLTIKEQITGHTLPCYSYTKHWSISSNGPPTGYVLLTNKTTNLSIIDININKSYIDEQRTTIRDPKSWDFIFSCNMNYIKFSISIFIISFFFFFFILRYSHSLQKVILHHS